MKNNLVKILILIICLTFGQNVFADTEEDVVVVTNVPYTASLTKKSSNNSASVNPATGTHTGLSTVFTLQTNGGDEHFDYIINSYIDIDGDRVSAFGNDGRLLFAHETRLPSSTAVENARTGSDSSKNVFAYPSSVTTTGGMTSSFHTNYKEYGNCFVILANDSESGDVTHTVSGTPCTGTYEVGLDESGSYKSVIQFTITSK